MSVEQKFLDELALSRWADWSSRLTIDWIFWSLVDDRLEHVLSGHLIA